MAEIYLMKSLKAFISMICYFGTGVVAIDVFIQKGIEAAMNESLVVNPAAKQIIFYLLIFFWIIKIVWFVFDKFHLERQERNLKMRKTEEEIVDLREGHEKGSITP